MNKTKCCRETIKTIHESKPFHDRGQPGKFTMREWLEFSGLVEFRKFRNLAPINARELARAKYNIDGLILALQEHP